MFLKSFLSGKEICAIITSKCGCMFCFFPFSKSCSKCKMNFVSKKAVNCFIFRFYWFIYNVNWCKIFLNFMIKVYPYNNKTIKFFFNTGRYLSYKISLLSKSTLTIIKPLNFSLTQEDISLIRYLSYQSLPLQ